MADLVSQLFNLIEQQNPLIAVESPSQERIRLLEKLTSECALRNVNCYIWMLEDDQLYRLQINGQQLSLEQVSEYKPNTTKTVREDYFEVLRFWKTTSLQGILILEGIFPWISQATIDSDFFLTAEWIKSALINLKLYNQNSHKTAILLGPNASLSSDIAALIPTITQELPTVEKINAHLESILPTTYSSIEINEIANASVGMYLADIEIGIRSAIAETTVEIQEVSLADKLSNYKISLLKRGATRKSWVKQDKV
ncbi:hypothetical protein FNW02_37565 [Komarekiella sp. 'clone 1']|uniref:Uncharacterized protein n=1 Tax=Komarekiella delphini-convector SJRDD-AB1 TaxID=2593771 RepID=A0AA41BAK6_9NOST|nr:hypothetical protein [Komarekiella delphini-convector]MBD6621250.1 hypothetical protein [Komarekiella delphini-convector SJRDD-AB1]